MKNLLACALVLLSSLSPAFAQEMSPKATEVWQELTNTCEQDKSLALEVVEFGEVIPDPLPIPVFAAKAGAYRQVELSPNSPTVEIIYLGAMTCNGSNVFCGVSGMCANRIIINDLDYQIWGAEPFLLNVEPSVLKNRDYIKTTSIIGWFGYGSKCASQSDPETDPLKSCLLTAWYDEETGRLVFQHDDANFPI